MRRCTLQFAAVVVLLVCFGSHVSEFLDHWDHTFQTGNDIASALIVVALTGGVALALAGGTAIFAAETGFSSTVVHPSLLGCNVVLCTPVSTHSLPPFAFRLCFFAPQLRRSFSFLTQ